MIAMMRSLLKEKGLPAKMWGEAVRHAIYILNCLPTKALTRKTPYEAWLGTKPQLNHICLFGCLADVKVQRNGLGKLDDRNVNMIYIGKELGTKAHRIYNPTTSRVHVSRDVEEGEEANFPSVQALGSQNSSTQGEVQGQTCGKGYIQKKGIDYDEIFAPITRIETVRLLLALAVKQGWQVHHLDVKSAFLNVELLEEVYVSQPMGFEKEREEHKVYRLLKSLYGLRQSPRARYSRLNKYLKNLGLSRCPYDHAVYTRREGPECLIVAVYVDDLLVTGSKRENIMKFKKQMQAEFYMSDLGMLAYYLGLEVNQGTCFTEVKQSTYAKRIL
ncbi:hypothetical protein AgCh_022911 [Apium graveolens]